MSFFSRFLQNHVLANLTFVLVLILGFLSYWHMPREQDPSINFNWIQISTIYPGAATSDVEKQVTDVLEDAIRNVSDIKFVSSNSRESISSMLVRFDDIDSRTYEKRVADLRREIEGSEDQLPVAAEDPFIFEITTANAFPTATVVVSAKSDDENLRKQATRIQEDLERIKGVGRVLSQGLSNPELHINFLPDRLEQFGLNPNDLANTVRSYYRNISAGSIDIANDNWSVSLTGTSADTQYLADLPVITPSGEIALGTVADIALAKEPADHIVRFNGRPSVLLSVTKKESQNILELVENIAAYVDGRRETDIRLGIETTVVDDQTQITRDALRIMQTNAALGLLMVLLVTWLFLGARIAILTGIAIPFILAGTFLLLSNLGQTLNVTVLLGVVISLGMLVDDAVVVVEAIYYRLQRGASTLVATVEGIKEIVAPVTTAVMTTIAAFLPLMLLPGILGKFMLVIPLVVTLALAISLVEAFWLLPAHVLGMKINFEKPSFTHRLREGAQRKIRKFYVYVLIKVIRCPLISLLLLISLFTGAIYAVATERIKVDFFASDPIRLFYVNIEMPAGTAVEATIHKVVEVEKVVVAHLESGESRSVVSYAGQLLTETEPLIGAQYGQILVSLKPKTAELRSVDTIIDGMRDDVLEVPGIAKASFLRLAGGPPVSRAISLKVRGDNIDEITQAVESLRSFMQSDPRFIDVSDDNVPGQNSFTLKIDPAAIQRTGIQPETITRVLRLLVDGEIVASFRHQGEKLEVRLQAQQQLDQINQLLDYQIPDQQGRLIALKQLVTAETFRSPSAIRHYNFRRAITLEADIDKSMTDTVKANDLIKAHWLTISNQHPGVDLDFSGALDDIQESINSIFILFLMGLGLIYLILGTQFRSYFQPFLILFTVPMAFTGVVFGLLISSYPLSLFTLYGVVALAGISVNAAIVMISTANAKLQSGIPVIHSIISAAKRRVIPILITSLTTIAGLFSLATGLGGSSLIWGPVAASMVWGLLVSTVMTLLFIPLMYRIFMARSKPTLPVSDAKMETHHIRHEKH